MDTFRVLASLVSGLTPRQSRVLMAVLKYAGSLERIGLTFLEEVYFSTGEYLDSYYKGYAIGVGKNNDVIIVGTDYLNCSRSSTMAHLNKTSVIKLKDFNKIRDKLINSGKISSPRIAKLVADNKYEVPTIDKEPVADNKPGGRRNNANGSNRKSSAAETRKSAGGTESFTITNG